jgi:hypothetical protein
MLLTSFDVLADHLVPDRFFFICPAIFRLTDFHIARAIHYFFGAEKIDQAPIGNIEHIDRFLPVAEFLQETTERLVTVYDIQKKAVHYPLFVFGLV